jgi:hypothetical protein
MNKNSQVPPVLLARATALWLRRRVKFPKRQYGDTIQEKEDFIIFRKVTVDPGQDQPAEPKAIFRVYFRFSRFSANVNKTLSLIPIPLIIAQPGFRSKTWMFGKDTDTFQGLYEWDSVEDAERYWDSFPMKLMKRRSVPDTLDYEIINAKDESDIQVAKR